MISQTEEGLFINWVSAPFVNCKTQDGAVYIFLRAVEHVVEIRLRRRCSKKREPPPMRR